MQANWETTTVAECAADEPYSTQIGPFGNKIKAETYTTTGVPVLRGVNVNRGRFHDDDFVFISEDDAAGLKNFVCQADDVILVHKGSLGQIGIIPRLNKYGRYIMGNSMMKARTNPKKVHPKFLYYWLSSEDGYRYLLSRVSQVGVPQLQRPLTTLREAEFPKPPIEEQEAIVNQLGALDDKIELNRRMNATLEAVAQAVFKEWFVDGAKEEWEEKIIGDLVQLIMGQSPKGDTYNDQGEGLPLLNGAGDFTAGFPEASRYTSNPLRTSMDGDIVFTMRGTIGNLCIGDREYALGRCVSALKPKESHMKWLVYFTLERGLDQLRSQAMGSVITGLTKEDINRVPVLVPDKDTAKRFHDIVDPLMSRREHNRNESRTLAALRDTLLPKLMRGEVRVRETTLSTMP